MAKSSLFREYRQAVSDLAEARLQVTELEKYVANLERQLSTLNGTSSGHTDDEVPERLRKTLSIIKSLGGRAKLGDIAAKSKLTGPGTLAQIRKLIDLGFVIQPDRGVYAIRQR